MSKDRKKRGPYKKYLKNDNIDLPTSTLYYRKQNSSNTDSCMDISSDDDSNVSINGDTIIHMEKKCDEQFDNISKTLDENTTSDDDTSFACESTGDSNSDQKSECDDSFYDGFNELIIADEFNDINIQDVNTGITNDEVSKAEKKLIVLALSLRHNFSNIAVDDILRTLNYNLEYDQYGSKYMFFKEIDDLAYVEHYYCQDCSNNLIFQENSNRTECQICMKIYNKRKLKEEGIFFYYLPLKAQFMKMVNSSLFSYFRKQCDESDVVNGTVYKDLIRKNIIGVNDITIMWNTDGVQLFKSSEKGITPVMVFINELPYRLRKDNPLLVGLFYGGKPPMNVYLKPFVEELRELSLVGFQSTTYFSHEPITIKVHTIVSSVDSVARPQVQNLKQFNGEFGCSYCYHKGERVPMGNGYARVYRGDTGRLRSQDEFKQHAVLALNNNSSVKGVKGPSIVLRIPNFDIIHSFPPEYMHNCLLGITFLFVTEWLNPNNHKKEWYLGSKEKELNDRLLSITPPTEITRAPRAIHKKYKASEWKNFLLYYSLPCLRDLMVKRYYNHWFLFVYSLHIFLKKKIEDEDFLLAESALNKFVDGIENLYGVEFMKYNVHIFKHLPPYIKMYGALWAWSTFPSEHFNGVIKHLYRGTQAISLQICKSYSRLRYLKNNSDIFLHPHATEEGRNLFTRLMNECKIKKCIQYGEHLRIFGKPRYIKLPLNSKVIIEQHLNYQIEEQAVAYDRYIYKHVLYHSNHYDRLKRRNNSIIISNDNKILVITDLMAIHRIGIQDEVYIVIGKQLDVIREQICYYEGLSSKMFSFIAKKTNSTMCLKFQEIKSKCVIIPHMSDKVYVMPLVNGIETD